MAAPRARRGEVAYGPRRTLRNLSSAWLLSAALLSSASAAAETVTVAALGDSLTAGYGLSGDAAFVPSLQDWLDERDADARVINAGVSGDTTAGGLARIGWTLTPEVDALILELGGNDLLRGIDPGVSRENLRGILEAAEAQGVEVLVVGLLASPNYGPEYKTAYDAMFPDLAAEFDALFVRDFFGGLIADGTPVPEARARYLQPDGLHPNADGVDRIVEDLGPHVLDLIAAAREGP